MSQFGLGTRLFFSHLVVMIVGVSALVVTGDDFVKFYLVQNVQQFNAPSGVYLRYTRTQLIKDFEVSWNYGIFWSVLIGSTAAGGLGYLSSKGVMKSLKQMEQITQKFAAGQLSARMPTSQIPELQQLSNSFNHMAASLEDVEQRRRELVSDLTHELRTPLTVIYGYLEQLSDGAIAPSATTYEQLARETTRLQRLVNDLQELSKAEAGYLPIRLQPVNLRPLLEALVARFTDQIWEEELKLKLDCPTTLPLALADVDRVEQIMVNLLGNALRHTTRGSITVQAWSQANKLWIAVIDTGQGIAAADLPHIFERFWKTESPADRSSTTSTRPLGGTGIGLAITRQLVELQGGEISVSSQLGVGSTFRFYLPLA